MRKFLLIIVLNMINGFIFSQNLEFEKAYKFLIKNIYNDTTFKKTGNLLPYPGQLKNNNKHSVKEVYLHSSRLREGKMVDYYELPLNNYLDIDTDKHTIEESIKLILDYIK